MDYVVNFRNEKENREFKKYYHDGKLRLKELYDEDGKLETKEFYYYENRKLKSKELYDYRGDPI